MYNLFFDYTRRNERGILTATLHRDDSPYLLCHQGIYLDFFPISRSFNVVDIANRSSKNHLSPHGLSFALHPCIFRHSCT